MQLDPRLKTKLETAASVFVVGSLAVVGGMLGSSSIPTSWDGWRPILCAGLAGGVASEIAWVRTLLATDAASTVTSAVTSSVTSAVERVGK